MTRVLLSAPLCPYIRPSFRFTCWPEIWIVPLTQSVDQFNACMQFHAYAPWQVVFIGKSTVWVC